MSLLKIGKRKSENGTVPMPDWSVPSKLHVASASLHPKSKIYNLKPLSAFSLVELLVVMAIMSIMIGLLAPAFINIGESNRLTAGAQMLIAELNKSRQEAVSRNRAVEVRFYTIPPKEFPTSVELKAIRAVRSVVLDETADTGSNARFGRLAYLPSGIQISGDSTLSTTVLSTNGSESLPVFGTANYVAFRFRPNGGMEPASLSTNVSVNWTLVSDRAKGTPPNNFATIQLDARTGRVRLFRP